VIYRVFMTDEDYIVIDADSPEEAMLKLRDAGLEPVKAEPFLVQRSGRRLGPCGAYAGGPGYGGAWNAGGMRPGPDDVSMYCPTSAWAASTVTLSNPSARPASAIIVFCPYY